jgi:hypothetical protein
VFPADCTGCFFSERCLSAGYLRMKKLLLVAQLRVADESPVFRLPRISGTELSNLPTIREAFSDRAADDIASSEDDARLPVRSGGTARNVHVLPRELQVFG